MTQARSPAIPLAVLCTALLVWFSFQTWRLATENTRLSAMLANQQALVQNSEKLRASLDTLASETAKLAAEGNPNARLLVDELRKRGVTINPSAARK